MYTGKVIFRGISDMYDSVLCVLNAAGRLPKVFGGWVQVIKAGESGSVVDTLGHGPYCVYAGIAPSR